MKLLMAIVALMILAPMGSLVAHHSAAAFDRSQAIIVTGTVQKFVWANPHSWLYMQVPDGKGGEAQWALEGGSVPVLARNGWTAKSIQIGQKLRVLAAPRKDGTNGGEFLSVTFADGKVLSCGII
jgi:hypothetical protein